MTLCRDFGRLGEVLAVLRDFRYAGMSVSRLPGLEDLRFLAIDIYEWWAGGDPPANWAIGGDEGWESKLGLSPSIELTTLIINDYANSKYELP